MREADLLFKPQDKVRHIVNSEPMIVIENEKSTPPIKLGVIGLSSPPSPIAYTGYVVCSWFEGKTYKKQTFHQNELILFKENEMSFDIFLTDIISLFVSATGKQIDNIKASVDSNKIALFRSDLVIQPGDLITRKMSNGGIENYEVIDPVYREKFATIPAGYDLKVRKIGIPEAKNREQQIINYHFHGNNNRVNNNSIDHSRNIVKNNENQVDDKISELKYEIDKLSLSKIDREEALDLIQALAEQMHSVNPRPSVIKSVIAGLPDAANIASIGSFLLETIKQ